MVAPCPRDIVFCQRPAQAGILYTTRATGLLPLETLLLVVLGVFTTWNAVLTLWITRRRNPAELEHDVDELAETVAQMARLARRERMREVRAAAKVDPTSAPPELTSPPEAAGLGPQDRKAALRARIFGKRLQ